MTPPAMTPAGRRTAARDQARGPGSRKSAGPAGSGHRRTLSRDAAPRSPRRVSGPLAGRAAALIGRVAGTAARTAPRTKPRMTSRAGAGPAARPAARPASQTAARPASQRAARTASRTPARTASQSAPRTAPRPQRARRSTARPSAGAAISARTLAFVGSLPDHPLLDRIVRGRTWIALLGLMLVGIVAMQVEQLKLGASIGRSVGRTSQLQTRNEQLQASVALLSDEQRIESVAAKEGMIMPPPSAVGFLANRRQTDIQKALSNIHAPDPSAFSALQTGSGTVVTSADVNAPGSGSLTSTQSSTSISPTDSSTQAAATSASTMTPATASASTDATAPTATASTDATAVPTATASTDTSTPTPQAPATAPATASTPSSQDAAAASVSASPGGG